MKLGWQIVNIDSQHVLEVNIYIWLGSVSPHLSLQKKVFIAITGMEVLEVFQSTCHKL